MRRTRVLSVFALAATVALLATAIYVRRPHPVVGHWKLDLPANSTGTGRRLILLSDGTGDLDGNAFHYRVVDENNLVVTYPSREVYVWPFTLKGDALTMTAFHEVNNFTREEAPEP